MAWQKLVVQISIYLLAPVLVTGCLKNTAEPEEKDNYVVPELLVDTETYWQQVRMLTPKRNGIQVPTFDAVMDANQNIHMVYYEVEGTHVSDVDDENDGSDETPDTEPSKETLYSVQYNVWDVKAGSFLYAEPLKVVSLNHNDRLSLALGPQNQVYVGYRGGNPKACNGNDYVADAMFSVLEGGEFKEYTGAIGYVERSAGALLDGHAGGKTDLIVDNQGNVHLIYQFLYEGCDDNNFRFPDLFYASKQPSQFENDNRRDTEIEEQVSGNNYLDGGNQQNTTGEITEIIINDQGEPLIFYYAEDAGVGPKGLYMAFRDDQGRWQQDVIKEGCGVTDLTAGQAENGDLHVFFIVDQCKDEFSALRHAIKRAPSEETEEAPVWQEGSVISNVMLGANTRHLDMVFNQHQRPQVVFYEYRTYSGNDLRNLISVELDMLENQYIRKDIAKWQDVGSYSKMLTDDEHEVYVVSYSEFTKSFHLFTEGVHLLKK